MTPANAPSGPPPSPHDLAAQWILRRDRGLTAAEQDELSQWLAADPRHGEALALHRWGWEELDRLTGLQTSLHAVADPDLLAPQVPASSRRTRPVAWGAATFFALAASVAVGLYLWSAPRGSERVSVEPAPISTALAAPCERRVLEDGSVVDLNRGAAVAVDYSTDVRRVRMERGEASFSVAKNAERPFIVSAGPYEVRAVGTAFNVRIGPNGTEVLVTEGKVAVSRVDSTGTGAAASLAVGDYSLLPNATSAPRVDALTPAQMSTRLAWQPRLLDFTDAPLATIVARFNAHNPVQLTVNDPELESLKLSATFRSDNVEGFVKLMENAFGMRAEWQSEREVALQRAR
jgi:transmembrane sensor